MVGFFIWRILLLVYVSVKIKFCFFVSCVKNFKMLDDIFKNLNNVVIYVIYFFNINVLLYKN